MQKYHVVWVIDVWADSHTDAAEAAWNYMSTPDSTAGVFTVANDECTMRIDLHQEQTKKEQH